MVENLSELFPKKVSKVENSHYRHNLTFRIFYKTLFSYYNEAG